MPPRRRYVYAAEYAFTFCSSAAAVAERFASNALNIFTKREHVVAVERRWRAAQARHDFRRAAPNMLFYRR